jgi:hypothetical protein
MALIRWTQTEPSNPTLTGTSANEIIAINHRAIFNSINIVGIHTPIFCILISLSELDSATEIITRIMLKTNLVLLKICTR